PILLFGLLPGTLLAMSVVRFLLSGDTATAAQRCPELGFQLLAGGWCVFFFSMSGCKLPTYILPAFPPLALVLGYFLSVSRWQCSRCLPAAAGVAVVVLATGHYLAVPWYAQHHSPMGQPDLVRSYCPDQNSPLVCYPRPCDSAAFYLGRDNLRSFRS